MLNIEKLKKLGYGDSISLKCYINRPNLTYLQNKLFLEMDNIEVNDKYITYFFIDIFVSDLENNKNTKIGFIKGCYVQPEEFMEDSDFYDTCDAESQELEEMASALIDDKLNLKEKYANSSDCICYISDFYIYKKFRECGIGSYILEELDDIMFYYSRDYITRFVLMPQPRVINNQRHTQNLSDKYKKREIALEKELRNFYKNNGFKEIENSKYMIKFIK